MSNNKDFQIPLPTEKLSYKFILDNLKEDMRNQSSENAGTKDTPIKTRLLKENVVGKPFSLPEGKKYFRIGEASEIIGLEPYVLRYWESEFKSIRPIKSKKGHRVYSRKDVEQLYLIKQLLHEEKFSIKGAKKKLFENRKEVNTRSIQEAPNKLVLKSLHQELRELIALAKLPA